jgi:hypothetical protein
VRGLLPIVRTPAFDMVSDGETFTLYIQPKSKAITGGMTVTAPSKNTFENLRPAMFLDSLMIRRIGKDELVSLTSDTRILEAQPKARHVIEEPDYNLGTYRARQGSNELVPLRVIHINRQTLQPYQQDIYDDSGKVVTVAVYDSYQKYGELSFPSHIIIRRPQDNLTLTLDIVKLESNQPLEDDQFKLQIPSGVAVQKLN